MSELRKGGPYYGPKGGKWADAKHTIPWKLEVKSHKAIFGHKEHKTHTLHALVGTRTGHVRLSAHEDRKSGPTMPPESVKHFINDLAGKVDLPKHESHAGINAVISGKASGAGSGTEVFVGMDGSTVRVTGTVDDDGNRTAVVYA